LARRRILGDSEASSWRGRAAQIVTFWRDYGVRKVRAGSLIALMETFLEDLESGQTRCCGWAD
jgi:hypothetical protein